VKSKVSSQVHFSSTAPPPFLHRKPPLPLQVADEVYEGYDDMWDKCEAWRKVPNATAADAPMSCSMIVPLSTLGHYFLRLGLPVCCLHALFVLWLARYSRKL
jgi:hypothetical protein